jgi:hypothetical protein
MWYTHPYNANLGILTLILLIYWSSCTTSRHDVPYTSKSKNSHVYKHNIVIAMPTLDHIGLVKRFHITSQ